MMIRRWQYELILYTIQLQQLRRPATSFSDALQYNRNVKFSEGIFFSTKKELEVCYRYFWSSSWHINSINCEGTRTFSIQFKASQDSKLFEFLKIPKKNQSILIIFQHKTAQITINLSSQWISTNFVELVISFFWNYYFLFLILKNQKINTKFFEINLKKAKICVYTFCIDYRKYYLLQCRTEHQRTLWINIFSSWNLLYE